MENHRETVGYLFINGVLIGTCNELEIDYDRPLKCIRVRATTSDNELIKRLVQPEVDKVKGTMRIDKMDIPEKPPLGVMPKKVALALYREKRKDELVRAMERYTRNFKAIPIEWVEEYNEILKESEDTE